MADRLERLACLAEQKRNRGGGLVWRLHPEHELEDLAVRVVPGETAFRFEEHRVDRLGLEFPVEHQHGGIVLGQAAHGSPRHRSHLSRRPPLH